MVYKSSFNGLEVSVKGVYQVYNISDEEFEILKRRFKNMLNGSNGNYTIYQNVNRKVYLKLFVHDIWIPIVFDIRNDLLKIFNSNKIYEKNIEKLSEILHDKRICIHVNYNIFENSWVMLDGDYKNLLSTITEIVTKNF